MKKVAISYEELFQRCGTKLTEEKVEELLKGRLVFDMTENGTPEIGSDVDGYKIIGYLGKGSFGTVCLASKNDLFFAIKFYLVNKMQRGADKEFDILHELLKSKEHEDFLTALEWKKWKIWTDFDFDDSRKKMLRSKGEKLCYIVMKVVVCSNTVCFKSVEYNFLTFWTGPSLELILFKQPLQENQRYFPTDLGIKLMKRAVKAIQLFHEMKRVHRDVKLDNFAMDLFDENRIILIDLGRASRAPQVNQIEKIKSYRDDCLAWFESFHVCLPTKIRDCQQCQQIKKHINLLGFSETMNFEFVLKCLQTVLDTENGVPFIPFVYAKTDKNGKAIVHGHQRFAAHQDDKKGRRRFVCRNLSCNFTLFVISNDCQKAEEGTEAIIVDTLNHHTCTSTI